LLIITALKGKSHLRESLYSDLFVVLAFDFIFFIEFWC
jgi:hypothetical protein